MFVILMTMLIVLFVAMLLLNFYFRTRVFGAYRKLVRNRVDFNPRYVFQMHKLREEVVPKYPEHEKEILDFARYLQRSIRMGTVLIVIITLVGAVLMYYRP